MTGNLEQAASEIIAGLEDSMRLNFLLNVPEVDRMYGRIGGADFYRAAIGTLTELSAKAEKLCLAWVVKLHSTRIGVAQSLLEKALQRAPIPTTAADAEPHMEHRDGQTYIVVGDGPGNGGYSIELRENGENIMHYR